MSPAPKLPPHLLHFFQKKWTPPATVTQATIVCRIYLEVLIYAMHSTPAFASATLALVGIFHVMIFSAVFVPAAVPSAILWRNFDINATPCNRLGLVTKPRLI